MHYTFRPKFVCSSKIEFDIGEDKKLSNVVFTDGCSGNLKAVSALAEGMEAEKLIEILSGIKCGMKGTSCSDQFSKAVTEALSKV